MKSLSEIQQNFNKKAGPFEKSVIAFLFLIWGVLTQLNDIMVPTLYRFGLGFGEALLLHFSFFMTYLIMAYPASKIIDRLGYKTGIMTGLGFAALGCLIFYTGALFTNFYIFIIGITSIASGVTTLQIAANGYIVLQSPSRLAASNLTFMQSLNSLGRFSTILFGFYIVYSITGIDQTKLTNLSPSEFIQVQADVLKLPYLIMSIIIAITTFLVYISKLPEFKTGFLPVEVQSEHNTINNLFKIKHLLLGVLAIFLYVGAEVSIGTHMFSFLQLPNVLGSTFTEEKGLELLQYYWGSAMVGRIIGGFILRDISPRNAIAGFATSALILTLIAAFSSGNVAVISIVGIGFFNSILFPSIFTLGINGLGHFAEEGASVMISAIVGGAIIPLLMIALTDFIGLQFALLLPAICYAYVIYYGVSGSVFSKNNTSAIKTY